MLNLGTVVVVDPAEHASLEELREAVGEVEVIWVEMGNTFALRHHLWRTGGDLLIRVLMDDGALYVGNSAGAIVSGRSIQTAFWKGWDDPKAGGSITDNSRDWEGLDLLNGASVFPHANGEFSLERWQNQQRAKHGHETLEVIPIADGEGVALENGQLTFVV